MVDQIQHPSVVQKVVGRLLHSSLSKNIQGSDGAFQRPTLYQRRAAYGKYSNAALRYPKVGAATILSSTASTICIQAPADNDQGIFANDFCYGSFSAASVRLVVLPVASLEHLKLLLQNQDEMIMNGRLSEPFNSCYDFLNRKIKDEGFASLWKGKTANFIRCLTAQLGAYLASYPFDTVHRRMMMTSGEGVKYESSLDAFAIILKYGGVKSLFKGASAPEPAWIGAALLVIYDKYKLWGFGKECSSCDLEGYTD